MKDTFFISASVSILSCARSKFYLLLLAQEESEINTKIKRE